MASIFVTGSTDGIGAVADLDDLHFERKRWDGLQAYSDSKLYEVMLAFAVARLWPGGCQQRGRPRLDQDADGWARHHRRTARGRRDPGMAVDQ